jgi:5-methylcytosine-specific restriction endonuclease McrA
MANPRSCGSINAELARAKTRRKAKRKPVVVKADAKRREFSALYARFKATGISHEQALAKAMQAKAGREVPSMPNAASDEFLASYEWRRVRMSALKHYGPRCQCCGATPRDGARMNVDHIKPRKLFPSLALSLDNLQILCNECNHGKGNWDMTDWRAPETESGH